MAKSTKPEHNQPSEVKIFYRNIAEVKPNPRNPRIIRDEKFQKLVKSIKDFPEMLEKRPLVCYTDTDGTLVVLGGNMRLRAAKEAGMSMIPVMLADDWTEEQKAEFLIKDNVGFGEWNWEELANEWDSEKLDVWGLDVPNYSIGLDVNNMTDDDVDITEEFDPIGTMDGKQRVVFLFDGKDEAESYLKSLNVEFKKMNMAWQVNMCSQFT
jgi:hypothetical protein